MTNIKNLNQLLILIKVIRMENKLEDITSNLIPMVVEQSSRRKDL